MATTPKQDSSAGPDDRALLEKANAEKEAGTRYESGLVPLFWLAIPFVLLLIYGYLS
jgi:hypothetical protein